MKTKVEKQYYTIGEVATYFGMSKKQMKRWDAEGKFVNAIGEDRGRRYLIQDCVDIKEGRTLVVLKATEKSEIQKTEEAKAIAKNKWDAVDYDTKRELRLKGYTTLEEGLKDLDAQRIKVDEITKEAYQIRDDAIAEEEKAKEALVNEQEALTKGQEALATAQEVAKKDRVESKARIEEARRLEKEQQDRKRDADESVDKWLELSRYHNDNIVPLRVRLVIMLKYLNELAEYLVEAGSDGRYKYTREAIRRWLIEKIEDCDTIKEYIEKIPERRD